MDDFPDRRLTAALRDVNALLMDAVYWVWAIEREDHHNLAVKLRDDFCKEWELPEGMFDTYVNMVISDVMRSGTTPSISIPQLEAIMIEKGESK